MAFPPLKGWTTINSAYERISKPSIRCLEWRLGLPGRGDGACSGRHHEPYPTSDDASCCVERHEDDQPLGGQVRRRVSNLLYKSGSRGDGSSAEPGCSHPGI